MFIFSLKRFKSKRPNTHTHTAQDYHIFKLTVVSLCSSIIKRVNGQTFAKQQNTRSLEVDVPGMCRSISRLCRLPPSAPLLSHVSQQPLLLLSLKSPDNWAKQACSITTKNNQEKTTVDKHPLLVRQTHKSRTETEELVPASDLKERSGEEIMLLYSLMRCEGGFMNSNMEAGKLEWKNYIQ